MEKEYIEKTLKEMRALGVHIRDTYAPPLNFDDFYANGNTYGGPSQFRIQWMETDDFAGVGGHKAYEVPGKVSIAYDAFRISMPVRFKDAGRDDPIVHECVHFLQHQTMAEEKSYIQFANTGSPVDYLRYVSQRVELEAHLVQVAYIIHEREEYIESKTTDAERILLREKLESYVAQPKVDVALDLIITAKNLQLI